VLNQIVPERTPTGVPALIEEPVPDRLVGAIVAGPVVEATAGAVLLRVPRVGRYLVRADGPALVERALGTTDLDLTCFRDGAVAAAVALLRREVVLRGAAVSVGGRALVLCGVSATGKSTLAAALAQRGHAALADAVVAISPDGERPVVRPVAPESVLWPDAARSLGLQREPGRLVRPGLSTTAYRLGPESGTAPLAAIAMLHVGRTSSESALEAIAGGVTVQMLLAARWHPQLAGPLRGAAGHFEALTRLAAGVRCVHVVRPLRSDSIARLVELVEGLAA
jgi:hypothetical protein